MNWDNTYQTGKLVWGKQPGELAVFACDYLKNVRDQYDKVEILDVGCGYGRDASYLVRNIDCHVYGIDNSKAAINMAQKELPVELQPRVQFQCLDFEQLTDRQFEVVFAANLYQILEIMDRNALRDLVKRALKPAGMFFLSTLSVSDPEHFGQGEPVENEANSFHDEKFLHFSTQEEIENDFSFLKIDRLFEHEYYEPRSNGQTHHHISWLLAAENLP